MRRSANTCRGSFCCAPWEGSADRRPGRRATSSAAHCGGDDLGFGVVIKDGRFALMTRKPSPDVVGIHDRIPVTLRSGDWVRFLTDPEFPRDLTPRVLGNTSRSDDRGGTGGEVAQRAETQGVAHGARDGDPGRYQ